MDRSLIRHALAAGLGAAALLLAERLGMPGRGEFAVLTWLAGFLAGLIAPGWTGAAASIAGLLVTLAAVVLLRGGGSLVWLVAAILAALLGHGLLVAATLTRALRPDVRDRAWRDPSVLAGAALAIGALVVFVWFAIEFAENPP